MLSDNVVKMRVLILLVTAFAIASAFRGGNFPRHIRAKRDASGALDIVTNNGQPIHAEVKSDGVAADNVVTDKVLPPKDVTTYEAKSLRKSWPLTSRLDLIRSLTRMMTLTVLVVSAVIEFYPLLQHLYYLWYLL